MYCSTSLTLYNIFVWAKIKIDLHDLCLKVFLFFFFPSVPFSPFLVFFHRPSTRLAASWRKSWEGIIKTGNSYHGIAKCSWRKFCSHIFTQISEHFHACFRLQWPNHCDLGITVEIFSSCRTLWVQLMPILVKGDAYLQKWNKGKCSLQPAQVSIG